MQLLLKHCFARAARINSVMYSDLVVTWCSRMREYERNHQTFGTWLDPDPDLLAALHPQKIPHFLYFLASFALRVHSVHKKKKWCCFQTPQTCWHFCWAHANPQALQILLSSKLLREQIYHLKSESPNLRLDQVGRVCELERCTESKHFSSQTSIRMFSIR